MTIQKSGYGKASNILFGDQKGNFSYVEFAGDESFMKQCKEQFMVHTNHYLVRSINPDDGDFYNSDEASTTRKFTIDKLKKILLDRTDRVYPIFALINQRYQPPRSGDSSNNHKGFEGNEITYS